jgi:hypothetical protein
MSITAPEYPLPQDLGLDQYAIDHKQDILKITDKLRKRGSLSPLLGLLESDIPILEYLVRKGLIEKYEIVITREGEKRGEIMYGYRVENGKGLEELSQKLSSLG